MTLAERIETEAPTRELADEALVALGWHHCKDGRLQRSQWGWLAPGEPPKLVFRDPNPLTSETDAFALVDEDTYCLTLSLLDGAATAEVWRIDGANGAHPTQSIVDDGPHKVARAITAALIRAQGGGE